MTGIVDAIIKSSLGGYRYNPILSDGERTAKAAESSLAIMKETRDAYVSDRYRPSSTAVVPYHPPEINIDLASVGDSVARELTPALSDLVQGQRGLAHSVQGLGYIGQQALQQHRLQTGQLGQLTAEARAAYTQRERLLGYVGESVEVQNAIRQQMGLANIQLSGIDAGISAMHSGIVSALGDISLDIQNLTDEVVGFKLDLLSKLDDMQAVFTWAARETIFRLTAINQAIRNPRQVKSFETWKLAERARAVGEVEVASKLLRASLDENPTESRSYTSLGLMALNSGDISAAKDFFDTGGKYAEANEEPSLSATNLIYLARIEYYNRHLPQALTLLKKAHASDAANVTIWFELARIYAELRQTDRAKEYVKAILVFANHPNQRYRQRAIGYTEQILSDPFLSLMSIHLKNI